MPSTAADFESCLSATDQVLTPRVIRLRVGDACLEVVTAWAEVLADLEAEYGDCTVPEASPDWQTVRCSVRPVGEGLVHLELEGGGWPDLIEVAQRLLVPLGRCRSYVERPPGDGRWRAIVDTAADGRLVVATAGRQALVDLTATPAGFLLDLLVAAVQVIQPGLLFLHAAAISIDGQGVLLTAPSRGGKSTASIALAARGHAFLGDDAAIVRVRTRELISFPKSVGVRDEALARSLGWDVRRCRHRRQTAPDGSTRLLVRAGDAVEPAPCDPVPLRSVFFFEGFADRTTARRFTPRLAQDRLRFLADDVADAWGLAPARRLMKLLTVVDVLSSARCHVLQLGSPSEVADTIERLVRDPCVLAGVDRLLERYLSEVDTLLDGPTVRIIERILFDTTRMHADAAKLRSEHPELALGDTAWLDDLRRREGATTVVPAAPAEPVEDADEGEGGQPS